MTKNVLLSVRVLFKDTVSQTEARVSGLPLAIQVNLSVTALAGDNTGETVTILSYTGN